MSEKVCYKRPFAIVDGLDDYGQAVNITLRASELLFGAGTFLSRAREGYSDAQRHVAANLYGVMLAAQQVIELLPDDAAARGLREQAASPAFQVALGLDGDDEDDEDDDDGAWARESLMRDLRRKWDDEEKRHGEDRITDALLDKLAHAIVDAAMEEGER